MARLRIGVEQLGADGLRVELDRASGDTDVIELAPGGGIRGRYEQDDESIGLRSIRAESLVVAELAWSWSTGRVTGSLRLRDVEIEAAIAIGPHREGRPSFVGSIRARGVDGQVELRLGQTTWTAGGLELGDFELTASETGTITLRVGQASASTLRARLGAAGRVELEASGLSLPEGLALEGGGLRLERAKVGELRAFVGDLSP
ncbi:MAG: hypothetical protein KC501_42125, partial [Myxococcales bacterium]|nr:hypothetical protein [Myxococcales bacterium]